MKALWTIFLVSAFGFVGAAQAQTNDAEASTAVIETNAAPQSEESALTGRLLSRHFTDYTIMLLTPENEPWLASWNDIGQMAIISNSTNGVVITSQFLKFPLDHALTQAVGNRDRFMSLALRQYCAVTFARSDEPEIMSQPLNIQSRQLGDHYFRFCPIWGKERTGGRRDGFFYLMLRGPAEKPRFTGETLILTIGYPELIAPREREQALKAFDVMLQNLSFY